MTTAHSTTRSAAASIGRALLIILLLIGALLALLIAFVWFWSLGLEADTAAPAPVASYAAAVAEIDAMVAAEGDDLNPLCHTNLLTHGDQTARAVVIFHGLGNCPQQFATLAQQIYDSGANVVVARLPYHGMADRLTDLPAQTTAEESLRYASQMVDLAHGLGDAVTVVGFSSGGSVAAWLAQNRADIDRAVIMSPMFGVQAFPANITRALSTAVRFLPNWWGWFDEESKEKIEGPEHAYPRYSSRALAEYLRVGQTVLEEAATTAPAVQDIRVITNLNDESVRPELARTVAEAWQAHGAGVFLYEFPTSAGLKHDMIDRDQPNQQVEIVYPTVLQAITAETPAP
jgi:carboxylesterase